MKSHRTKKTYLNLFITICALSLLSTACSSSSRKKEDPENALTEESVEDGELDSENSFAENTTPTDPLAEATPETLSDESIPVAASDAGTTESWGSWQTSPSENSVPNLSDGADYTTQAGDTLMRIAYEQTGSYFRWKEILRDNQDLIQNPNSLPAGLRLKIRSYNPSAVERNGNPYLIKIGDTLGLISKSVYGTQRKWKKIWDNNKSLIQNPNLIFAGFTLYYIPELNDSFSEPSIPSPKLTSNSGPSPAAEPYEKIKPAEQLPAPVLTPSLSADSGLTGWE